MFKKILIAALVMLVLLVLVAAAILVPAHIAIRQVRPELPALGLVRARLADAVGAPSRLRWINTSSQSVIRGLQDDPHPEQAFRLCHSSFVLEWPDGRILLIDLGMTREQARDFGAMGELFGGGPAEVHTTVAETLGRRIDDVGAIVLTHLHVDHVDGIRDLCAGRSGPPIRVFMTAGQVNGTNHTTSGGLRMLKEAECVEIVALADRPLAAIDGFPGVFVTAAGGHTPGTQIITAAVGDGAGQRTVAFTGDIVNHIDGIELDLGKSFLYRLLIVPESEDRQRQLRGFLRSLREKMGAELLVSHDEDLLNSSRFSLFTLAAGSR